MLGRRLFLPLIAVFASIGLFGSSYEYFKGQELEKAAARLTLYRSNIEAELRHFAHLPFLLSQDPFVIETLNGRGDPDHLNRRLARFSQSAGIDAIYLMDRSGLTIAASNAQSAQSFIGQNYAFRPYFQEAIAGELGAFYGIGATTGIPGYFYAIAVRPERAVTRGVIAIKIDLSQLQQSWAASGEQIILSNGDGVVLLASDPDWRYRTLEPLSSVQRDRLLATRQFGKEPLEPLAWRGDVQAGVAEIGDEQLLYLRNANLPNSWSLHFFVSDDPVVARAGLTTLGFMLVLLMSFVLWQFARVLQMRAALVRSEHNQRELRQANQRLAEEIEVRRDAEASLQKTQAELERAGRLAALGQLASSVTHELGQPLAAMRNQLAASEMTSGVTPLHGKMNGLVARMESITRQLKFFSRKGRDQFEPIDLRNIIENALELLEPTISHSGADVGYERFTDPLPMLGNRLRIEQVFTNIIRNALDATEHSERREIVISSGVAEESIWVEVADTGHGLGDQSFDDLREPFATSRESGRGMGLGLTISAGIVSDHGGTITAENRASGGACFRVILPRDPEEGIS